MAKAKNLIHFIKLPLNNGLSPLQGAVPPPPIVPCDAAFNLGAVFGKPIQNK
jgi:hypothetical protein